MSLHEFQIPVVFRHRVAFTRAAFDPGNDVLRGILRESGGGPSMVVIDEGVTRVCPALVGQVAEYVAAAGLELRGVHLLGGGEAAKADDRGVREVWRWIDEAGLDRHSQVLVIGGGAVLDAVGFAAATAHRGVRLVRLPTTTLSQADSGVGVKCAINAFGKKNWIGAFAVPHAVLNDAAFLHLQDEETRRAGLIEAVKVALVKDAVFFDWIEAHAEALAALDADLLEECVQRSALLHARHIAEGGDPFENGSSRPLDFGHWAAHKLESLVGHGLSHAHAVSVGIALDSLISTHAGWCSESLTGRVLRLLATLRLPLVHPALRWTDDAGRLRVLEGIDEFRQHLGGPLTVMMLREAGRGIDVHELDGDLVSRCVGELERRAEALMARPR
jgi:3-dehydroquinate synthase